MKIFAFTLIFLSHTAFPMDIVPAVKQAGIFDTLPRELQIPVFELLGPKEFNNLRKSCKIFREFFSCVNASPVFIRYLGQNLCRTDLLVIRNSALQGKFRELQDACKECCKSLSSSCSYSLFYYV